MEKPVVSLLEQIDDFDIKFADRAYGALLVKLACEEFAEKIASDRTFRKHADISDVEALIETLDEFDSDLRDLMEWEEGSEEENDGFPSPTLAEENLGLNDGIEELIDSIVDCVDNGPTLDFDANGVSKRLEKKEQEFEDLWDSLRVSAYDGIGYLRDEKGLPPKHWSSSATAADQAPEIAHQISELATKIASRTMLDAESRCAAITAALALLIDPKRCTIAANSGSSPAVYRLLYENLDLRIKDELSAVSAHGFAKGPHSRLSELSLLQDINAAPNAEERSGHAKQILQSLLPAALNKMQMASVFGLALAVLHGEKVTKTFSLRISDSYSGSVNELSCSKRKISIDYWNDKIITAHFEGLSG